MRLEQAVLGQRPGGDQADDLALQRRLAGAGLGVFHLLGDGDAEAAADQPGEVGLGRVHRDAAHRDGCALVLAAPGQRDVERGGGRLGVGEEQLVEVAHAQEQQRVGIGVLQLEPLRHGRRRALGGGGLAGG